ncbi:hypothetical protein WJX84_007347 [Apatococcus fuscideae]|uniref:Nucleolar GTP-binding protein 1 n=1 Tax=Apatococcus fuscideae TaxID=2026836 RepID=A0AAW1SQZ1_9CHLO
MPLYNFKTIKVVPTGKDFIDIVLSRTQRQTPTVVHNGWAITRIRSFYMRKVKYTQSNWHDKLSQILDDFPKVDDIHPFYADLLNVLYDKDHFKLALGQLNMARNLIGKVAQDYVRLLKYGDSLYRCKQLKRAALGRMCTIMKKQTASLAYLEQVRQHMSRLPSIDPNTRTLLVCGYPNVGKSSFMNKITRADVDVQPYAFTTKSLFIGHMDYKYLRWQVIDTPGILDRPLEERNTIEMQSVTALAHLRAAVLYIVDISEQCGYTIAQQAALFHSIKPLFASKPLLVVANKTDAASIEALSPEDQAILRELVVEAAKTSAGAGVVLDADALAREANLLKMSTLTEEGVMDVKQLACDRLLASRVEMKLQGKRVKDITNRIHVSQPQSRDGSGGKADPKSARPACIPTSVLAKRAAATSGAGPSQPAADAEETELQLQERLGGAGVYSADMRKRWQLSNPGWKYDIAPEIIEGHNIADFIDPDIEAKLADLEAEEDALAAAAAAEGIDMDLDDLTPEEMELLGQIKNRKRVLVASHRRRKSAANNHSVMPRGRDVDRIINTDQMKKSLDWMGYNTDKAVARVRSQSRTGRKRMRSEGPAGMDVDGAGDVVMEPPQKRIHSSKSRSMSRGRALSTSEPGAGKGIRDASQRNKAIKISDKAMRKRGKQARRGEGDRHIPDLKPKHLLTGKRGKGKTDRR